MSDRRLVGGGPDGTGNSSGNARTLDELARQLRLTAMQRAFAEALATDKCATKRVRRGFARIGVLPPSGTGSMPSRIERKVPIPWG